MRAVNLLPEDLRAGSARSASRSEGGAYAVLVVVGGLALLALLYGIADHQISSRRAQAASLTLRAERAQAAASALAPYTNFIALREQRMHAVSELVDTRFDWAHAMHEFGRVLPRDASLSSLVGAIGSTSTTGGGPSASTSSAAPAGSTSSGSSGSAGSAAGASVTSATPPGSLPTFTVVGCATSQAGVALTLDRLRLIDGVSEVTLQSSTKPTTASSGAGGSNACPGTDPAFTVEISFDPIPSESTTGSSQTRLTSATGGQR